MRRKLLAAAVSLAAIGAFAVPAAATGTSHSRHDDSRHADSRHDDSRHDDSRHDDSQFRGIAVFRGDVDPVPHDPAADGGSETEGRSLFVRTRNKVFAVVVVRNAAPGLPHAQHIHSTGVDSTCPAPAADMDGDGLINTVEGLPDYGPIVQSLTTEGDASPASALAVERFPVANSLGFYVYFRVFTIGEDIPVDVAANLDKAHVVVHGIDTNNNGEYDFSAGPSLLDPSLPLEATVPAACGPNHSH